MGLAVNVLCRNLDDDRVIPRFSRCLRDQLGWNLTARPDSQADVYYLSGYFEYPTMKKHMKDRPIAAYFTHLEEMPINNSKAKMFHSLGKMVDLRIVTAQMYAKILVDYGNTIQINPPIETTRFTIPIKQGKGNIIAGFSGYTYGNGRKGEKLAERLVQSNKSIDWRASGRGWPCQTNKYKWSDLHKFYKSLDVLIVTASVEGVPMPPLEALACGVSIVIPQGVGLLDELKDEFGIYRYKRGNYDSLRIAFDRAIQERKDVDKQKLRDIIEPYSIYAWCEQHRSVFDEVFN